MSNATQTKSDTNNLTGPIIQTINYSPKDQRKIYKSTEVRDENHQSLEKREQMQGEIEISQNFLGICNIYLGERRRFELTDFELQSYVGSGAFGKVYKVKLKETGEIYAAKISKKRIEESSEDDISNLSREVDILSKLKHPSILNFLFYSPYNFKRKDKPVIITEFVQGGTLSEFIETDRFERRDWDDTNKLIVIYGIAAGMSYLHSHEIIHRDLKPENVLIDDLFHPKIADFGLSKFKELNQNNFNSVSATKGTPMYMAPEIWRDRIYTKAGDVYAYGMILYEIFTQYRPSQDFNYTDILTKIVNGSRPEFNTKISDTYKDLIEKCWHQDMNERPTFDSILDQLKNNKKFILESVNERKFRNYVDYIENQKTSFNFYSQAFYRKTKDDNENKEKKTWPSLEYYPYQKFCQLERNESKQLVIEAETDDNKKFELGRYLIKGCYDFPFDPELGLKYIDLTLNNNTSLIYYIKMLIKGKIIPTDLKKAL